MSKKIQRMAFVDSAEFTLLPLSDGKTEVPDSFLLLPYGKNKFTKDGQHGEFEFTEKDADAVIAEFNSRGRDLVVDYEHQTLSGREAPAAGWIERLEKSAEGLVAKMRYWTDRAKDYLLKKEYRMKSPVLLFSRSGKNVTAVHSVALTNHPGLHNYPALVADDAAADEALDEISTTKQKGSAMDKILKILGLLAFADRTPEEQSAAVEAEIEKLKAAKEGLDAFLKLHDSDSLDKVTGKIQGMVPAEEKKRLEDALKLRDAEAAVAVAMSDGKVSENFKAWATDFAFRDLAAFKSWSAAAPRICPDNKVPAIQPPAAPEAKAFSDAELKILRNVGLTDEAIKNLKKE